MTQPIKAFKKSAPRMVTAQGARRELEDLSSAIGYWDDEHHLARRPKVWLPEKPESPRDAMTRSQCAALLWGAMGWRKGKDGKWKRLKKSARANRDHLRRFIVIGIYTGTRPGVIPKLLTHVSAVQAYTDLADGMIYRRGKAEKDHKTKRRPMVRCPDRLLAHMRRWARLDAALNAKRKKEDLPPIISVLHHGGRPITGRIRRAFASCVADAGLPAEITPHWLRHTCATLLMEQKGVDVWEAAAFTGMTVQTLEKCYGHHRPDHQAAARKAAGGKRA
jgi:integrase